MSLNLKRKWGQWFLAVYFALVLFSAAYRAWNDGAGEPVWGESFVEESPVASGLEGSLRYLDLPGQGEGPAAVLLLGDGSAFGAYRPAAASSRRLLAIDVSSVEAARRARSVEALLRSKGLEGFHLLGQGAGADVALQLTELRSDARSLALASDTLLPEFELLGDYSLNQALKGLELGALWLLDWSIPHFGQFSWPEALSPARAWRSYDRDKRPNGALIAGFDGPLRLGVQSEAEGAFLAGVVPQALRGEAAQLAVVEGFWQAAERGEGARALEEPRLPYQAPVAGRRLGPWEAGILLGLATFASEDLACIGGGLLAAHGSVALWVAVAGCLLGIFVGDLGIYVIGRVLGPTVFSLPLLRRLATPAKVERCARWFERRGILLIVATRFLPGSRVPTYLAAGVVKVGVIRFSLALFVASAIWTPLLVGATYLMGEAIWEWVEGFGKWAPLVALAALVGLLWSARVAMNLLSWKGRRLLLSRWRRLVQWEFWPTWALYPPVLVYIGWLMLRHRSATLPSVTNPCMPQSGLVYESKSQILRHLTASGVPVARYAVISWEKEETEKLADLRRFMAELGLGYPIALKPDVGQRGQGVCIVRDESEAERFFVDQQEDTIAQEYVPGVEYGVFYCRYPSSEKGWVMSITDKRMTSVVGDGRSTLERLILSDRRAICMARYFLKELEAQLDQVIPEGEVFKLTSLGTHCRGALFLDGASLLTPELEAAVDAFSRKIEGFHYGRYDVRAPSAEAFARGEGLRVIELNGLTSESTNMYDPKHSLLFAWRTLFAQWKLVFEIARQNRLAGHEPESPRKILQLAWGHARGAPSRDLS